MAKRISYPSLVAVIVFFTVASNSRAFDIDEQNLVKHITTREVELPISLSGTYDNWRIWTLGKLTTRLFQGIDSGKNVYIGCTSSTIDGYVFKVKNGEKKPFYQRKFEGVYVRGLYVHSDGSYAVLLWNNNTKKVHITKIDKKDNELWKKELGCEHTTPYDIRAGDSRLEYGNGEYRAYFHVHGVDGYVEHHESDTYFSIDDSGNTQEIWERGCSHPMSNLLRYHPETKKTLAVCAADDIPGKGIFTERYNYVYHAPGNKLGNIACEIGGLEIRPGGTWILAFNALQPERDNETYDFSKDNQDIGVAIIGKQSRRLSLKFLTNTTNINEEDACISYIPGSFGGDSTKYLLGWKAGADYLLSVIDPNGDFIVEPVKVTEHTKWGARDDSFRTYDADSAIYWLYAPDSSGNKVVITKFEVSGSYLHGPFPFLFSVFLFFFLATFP